jgi:hypothetical protein
MHVHAATIRCGKILRRDNLHHGFVSSTVMPCAVQVLDTILGYVTTVKFPKE